MKRIETTLEGLLDVDFDIKDENIRATVISSTIKSAWSRSTRSNFDEYRVLGRKLDIKESEFFAAIASTKSATYGFDKIESELNKGNYIIFIRSKGSIIIVQFVWKDKRGISVFPTYSNSSPITFDSFNQYKTWIIKGVKNGNRIWLTQRFISLIPNEGEQLIKNFLENR